jgi:hypothetical protein
MVLMANILMALSDMPIGIAIIVVNGYFFIVIHSLQEKFRSEKGNKRNRDDSDVSV